MDQTHIVVLGAGVLGLTDAFELRERGYRVTILARDLPHDTFSQTFASPWAGANWCSFATLTDIPAQRRDEITFRKWLTLHTHLPPEVMAMVGFTDISPQRREAKDLWFSRLTPDFAVVEGGDGTGAHAIRYKSFTISVPLYTRWLVSELTSPTPTLLDATRAGPPVQIRRCSTLTSLSAVRSLVPTATLIVNATGVGAADLSDVRDPNVYPIRGQTVLVNVPAFKAPSPAARCVMKLGSPANYVIPRARSGQVILGGSFDIRQSNTTPDKVLAETILKECAKLVPEIVPEGKTWREIDVVSHNVGLRPAREGGARVEVEEKGGVTVVHSYGIGPAGYQASFGIAKEVADLVDGVVARKGGVQSRL
ncbi:FAD dependent oxidoreductase [Kalmanozyma brasiliensis GHG001]|uniref:FAD dependent oxidoreductase domain-containing protein n=1 Tax=Kalmanozyma brasiliensis (strain GHG001) TaxID=1365824 RepID=V5EZD1_KALBG|nr:FAD dependent oxidoreductase [Kalmanozyma brasiliensis GHG001]EST08209.1 FAD dependent oxidoreductase [Kalmanozyma brasiliensis GHG001]